ncbi:hypothetical protein ACH5RR_002336 [Cinchona calisaya]|uniref:Protein kinase domain-containing protein n=1 Tax=Cinchona calisaya TaxID=153742 RepID=A0ABD3B6K3_9GENT
MNVFHPLSTVRLGSLSEVCTAQVQVQGGSQNGISRFLRLPRGSEQGTLGTSKITCAYDVYCCGKLFLELITGNRGISAANNSNTEDWMANLLPYIVPDNKKLILSILDPSLIIDDHLLNKVWKVAFVAKACLSPKPSDRPQMPRLVTALKQNIAESFTNYGKMLVQPNVRIFSFSELKVATRNLESDTILGKGEYGTVYQGWLDVKSKSNSNGGSVVAVKKLHSTEILRFHKWKLSVNLLGRLSHPNLLKFLGYCWDKKELLLVYEFMQLRSLENLLFGRDSAVQPLPWDIRLKISIGAARGLSFLHALERQGFFGQKRKGQGFYKHFQPSNILLDGSYNAKISGFGVAYIDPPELVEGAHPYYYLRGKYVYAAPQYVPPTRSNDLYVDNDVYGFGVILMEMLTGVSAKAGRQPRFGIESRNLESIMDPRLDGKYASEAAAQIVQLALKCIQILPEDRPSMKEVVDTLERIEFTNEGPYIAS